MLLYLNQLDTEVQQQNRLTPLRYNPKWHKYYHSAGFCKNIHSLQRGYLATFYGTRKFLSMVRHPMPWHQFSTRYDIVRSYVVTSSRLRKKTLPEFRNYLITIGHTLETRSLNINNNSHSNDGYWFYKLLIRKHTKDNLGNYIPGSTLSSSASDTKYLKSINKRLRNSSNGLLTLFSSIEDGIKDFNHFKLTLMDFLNIHTHSLIMTDHLLNFKKVSSELNTDISNPKWYLTLQPYYVNPKAKDYRILHLTGSNSNYCFRHLIPFVKYLNKQTTKLPIVKSKAQYNVLASFNKKQFTKMAGTIYKANGGDRGRINHYHLRFNQRSQIMKRNLKRRIKKNSIELELNAIRNDETCSNLLHTGELPGNVPELTEYPTSAPTRDGYLWPFVDTPHRVGTGELLNFSTLYNSTVSMPISVVLSSKKNNQYQNWFQHTFGKT